MPLIIDGKEIPQAIESQGPEAIGKYLAPIAVLPTPIIEPVCEPEIETNTAPIEGKGE